MMMVMVHRPQRTRCASCRRSDRCARPAANQSASACSDRSADYAVLNSLVPVVVV